MSSREEALQHFFASMSTSKRLMQAHFQQSMQQFGISQAQAQLLFTIEVNQPVSFKQLASLTSLTPGAITQLVNPLAERNYITRTHDIKDRRIVYIALSENGVCLLRKIQANHEKIITAMVEELTDEEVRTWVSIQDKMLHYLETHPAKSKGE